MIINIWLIIFFQLKSNSRSTNEVRDIHKEQMNELEIRLSNSKESENILIDEMSKLKNEHLSQTAKHEAEQSRSQKIINDQAMKWANFFLIHISNWKIYFHSVYQFIWRG